MDDCIFCKIVAHQIPAAEIWEDKAHLAILDINPNTKGMALVMTKRHFDSNAFEMPEKDYKAFFSAAKKVAKILEKSLEVKRVALVMEGMGVNHAHIKLYPLHGLEGKFVETWAKEKKFFERYEGYISTQLGPEADRDALKALAEHIKRHREKLKKKNCKGTRNWCERK